MTEVQSFQEDCVAIVQERLARGEIDRRGALKMLGALGVAAAIPAGSGRALAQDSKTITLVNWGGIANDGFGNYYGKPFEAKKPGVKVVMDSSGPSAGKIRTMVESKKVTWDLCDSSAGNSIMLGGQGLLEEVDYTLVKKTDLLPKGFAYSHGAAPYSFSSVLVYDAAKFGADPPKSWADFIDFKKYPGRRMLRRDALGSLDALMMANGADPAKLYPMDLKKGIEHVKAIKANAVYWNSGSESEQIMRTGEASMGILWHTRAKILHEESGGKKLTWTWNQGILQAGIFVIPKGNPSGKLAHECLGNACADAESQIGLLGFLGNGPTNPRAAAKVPENLRIFNPTDTENAKKQVVLDGEWWGKNYAEANQQYLDAIAS
jgi:putative spermidine/putrescine transport system substrate-binding protein